MVNKDMATINVDENENLEKAIKRFKRMVEKEGIIREYKSANITKSLLQSSIAKTNHWLVSF